MNIHGPQKFPYFPALISMNICEKSLMGEIGEERGSFQSTLLGPNLKKVHLSF